MMQDPTPEPPAIYFNFRGLIAVLVLSLLAIAGMAFVYFGQGYRLRNAGLAEARRLIDEGRINLAVRTLDAILELNPLDTEVFEVEANLLAENAQSFEQLLKAAAFNDRFARLHPDAPGAQDARRRTADLFIRFGDLYLESSFYRNLPETSAFNMRHRAAVAVAQSLIEHGAKDAGAYLLLARATEQTALAGDPQMLEESIRTYRKVLETDPDHLLATERLANLLIDMKHDRGRAIRLLDQLAKRRPNSAQLRLIRYRFFVKRHEVARASAEMEALLKLAPNDPEACLEAADLNLRRGRTTEARRYVAKLPVSRRDDPRVRVIRGLIELNENHPEKAMEIWREGLIVSRGADPMLTWNLAYSLIQIGKLDEASLLISQFRRLIGGDASPSLNLLLGVYEQKTGYSLKASVRLEGLRERIDPHWLQLLDSTLGRCYGDMGDLAKSASAFRRILQENPRSLMVRLELAEVLTNSQPQEAAEIIETGFQYFPDDPSLWVAMASAKLRKQENLPTTMRLWEPFDHAMQRAVQLAPKHPALTMIRSRRKFLEGKTADATAILEEAIRREPRKLKLWETYIEILVQARRPNEALAVLDRASRPEVFGDSFGFRLARFEILEMLGRAQEARAQLTRNLENLPLDYRARIWEALGHDFTSKGDAAGARETYIRWAEQIPEDVRPRFALLDMAIFDTGIEGQAAAASEALEGLGKPTDEAVLLNQAREFLQQAAEVGTTAAPADTRLREAERILETVRAMNPQSTAIDVLQGKLAERRGIVGDATMAYRRAWDRGSESVLPLLVDLLARTNPGDLERLGTMKNSPKLVRLSTRAFLKLGQPERAARIAADDPGALETPEARAWRIEFLGRIGKPDQAEPLLQAEAARRPDSIDPWIKLIRCQAKQGHTDAVTATLEEARRAIKDERTNFVKARLLWAAGDQAGADRDFRACLEEQPEDVEILLEASDFAQELGHAAESEAYLKRILTVDRNNRKAIRKLALHLVSRPFDEASWERAWTILGPDFGESEAAEDRLARVILLSKGPRPDHRQQAIERLEALVVDLPGDVRATTTARSLLARLYIDTEQADRAIQLLARWVDQGDDNAPDLTLYAEALLRAGRLDQASAQLDRLAKIAPGDDRQARLKAQWVAAQSHPGESAADLEQAFLALGDAPGARAFGREAFALIATASPPSDDFAERVGFRLASKDPKASWMPAMIIGRHGRASEALSLCRAAVEVADPADAREACRVAVGVTLADAAVDHNKELESILEAAALRDPDGDEISLQLAQLRHRQGRYEDAVVLYRDVVERRPELRPSIQNNLAWILSENLQRPGEAIGIVNDLMNSTGRTAAILDTRGVVLTRLGRPVEAIKDLEEAARIGHDPVFLFHLARAYRDAGRLGDFDRCREMIRRTKIAPEALEPSERAELATLLRP